MTRLLSRHLPIAVSAAAVLVALVGCATSTTIRGPDGTQQNLIACQAVELCYSQASEVCNGRYKIVNTTSEVTKSHHELSTTTKMLVKCSSRTASVSDVLLLDDDEEPLTLDE